MSSADQQLIVAANRLSLGDVRAALDDGADPNVEVDGLPLLTHVADLRYNKSQNSKRLKVARALLDGGADPNLLPSSGRHDYGGVVMMVATRYQNRALIDDLLDAGASLHATNPGNGQSVLHVAADRNHKKLMTLCLDAGIDPNTSDDEGNTPLHQMLSDDVAVKPALLRMLLKAGADPNAVNDEGVTPVMCAAQYRDTSDLKRLVKAGGDLTLTDHQGRSVLHYAAAGRRKSGSLSQVAPIETLTWLREQTDVPLDLVAEGTKETLLHLAADKGERKMVTHLLEEGLDPEAVNANGETPRDVTGRKSVRKIFDEWSP